ncbi:ABC transporter ATP-binding protein [Desulfobotulus sp.]|jgi:branched-chain amino acid transport system ATP-binding protein|uniref:ABC transporter ATP-binding protein n=1 Tax=Desulfobotulus sp. TaxID=1940337 RepID=UPI002A365050|nr:ABC transporter ATP-binding protein [Desulfobotulus sp.]MDY0163272.1 ABC transporter ATP-binding protein [Desulfobotulus sp.]
MEPILKVQTLTMDFGGLRALNRVSLDIRKGEIVALIGPNGAGKTTFFNCITGIYTPTHGDIFITPPEKPRLRINGMKANKVTEKGLARTFQNIRLFPNMTALENVMIGRHVRTRSGILGAIFRPPSVRREERETAEYCYALLKKVGLSAEVNELAKNLSYGAQRRLEIARAMATDPFLLLLDEPAAGMNPSETLELDQLIRKIRDEDGISILLIEHDMKLVMNISERIFVMDYGSKIAEGAPMDIKNNPLVIKAYLGEESHADA